MDSLLHEAECLIGAVKEDEIVLSIFIINIHMHILDCIELFNIRKLSCGLQ